MIFSILADIVVAFHLAYVAYVVVGLLAILVGLAAKWQWVRNPWFRWTHLAAIGIVAVEALLAIECPLTDWERNLRLWARQPAEEGTFVGRLLHNVLIYDNVPHDHWAFTASYVGLGVLVLALSLLAPPRRRKGSQATG